MGTMWQAANYLREWVHLRLRTTFNIDSERGALSLEWIVIAVALVAAGAIAAGLFNAAINAEGKGLP